MPANRVHGCIGFDRSESKIQNAIESVQPDVERTILSEFETREQFFRLCSKCAICSDCLPNQKHFLKCLTDQLRKIPHGNSARLSAAYGIIRKYNVGVGIIAKTKVGRGQTQLGFGCSRRQVCRRLCCTRGRRGREPNGSLRR